jgi:hypothetical protein
MADDAAGEHESKLISPSTMGHSDMTMTATFNPTEIRPLLQNKIGQMSDDQVQSLHRVMQKLEARQLWEEIKADGARDRTEGKYDRLNDVLTEVRAEMEASRA